MDLKNNHPDGNRREPKNKMKQPLFIYKLLFLATGIFSSCMHPDGIPKDLYIKIEGTPSQPGAGGAHVVVLTTKRNESGKLIFEWTLSLDNQIQRVELSDTTVQKLVDELRSNRVFKLKDRYTDYNILDGGTDVLTVRMNAREKIITMDNSNPKELEKFFRLIYRPQEH